MKGTHISAHPICGRMSCHGDPDTKRRFRFFRNTRTQFIKTKRKVRADKDNFKAWRNL